MRPACLARKMGSAQPNPKGAAARQGDGCRAARLVYHLLGPGSHDQTSRDLTRMTEIPASRASRLHRILAGLAWIACSLRVIATALAFTAPWIPAFDLINDARPFGALAAVVLFLAALAGREWRLIRPTAPRSLLHARFLLLPPLRAADAAPNLPAALRLLTPDRPPDS